MENTEFIDSTPIPQFVIDLDHKITHWNRAMEVLTGFPAEKMIGTRDQWRFFYSNPRPVLADLIVDNKVEEVIRFYRHNGISKSEIIPFAWQATGCFADTNGRERELYFLAAPVKNREGGIIGAIETVQDLTQRVRAENELRESRECYRILTEQVADGVAVIQEGRFCFVNKALAEIFGCTNMEDLLGSEVIALLSDDSKPAYLEIDAHFHESGRLSTKILELRCRSAQKTELWIEASNNLISWNGLPAVLTTIRDITGRKEKELFERAAVLTLKKENDRLKQQLKSRQGLGSLVGGSRPMQAVYDAIVMAASVNANVIIYGESGTGKELVARTIHALSDRRDNPFIAVNCGAIPENLFESEFFGYKKGAFSGATIDKMGLLESARGGILFLDEIGEIPLNMQVKLLRAIDGGGYTPIGSTQVIHTDTRFVAATNKSLKEMVKKGLMREDFFYRTHVVPIQVPPLRARMDDLPLLVHHFLSLFGGGFVDDKMEDQMISAMEKHHWPGNVRELQNAVQRYLAFNRFDILDDGLPDYPDFPSNPSDTPEGDDEFNLSSALERFEKRILIETMRKEQGNRTRAAISLGIERRSLQRKLQKFKISGCDRMTQACDSMTHLENP